MTQPQHIILVIADSLRYDSVWGNGDPRLPFLKSHSASFHQAYSAGCWTLPSTASIFTGVLPHVHGATTRSRGMKPSVRTLAESLKSEGYQSIQITANPVTTHIFGLDRGFDRVERVWRSLNPGNIPLANILVLLGKRRIRDKFLKGDFITGQMTEDIQAGQSWVHSFYRQQFERAHEVLQEANRQNKKTFLFINLMETHFPYHISNRFRMVSPGFLDKMRELKSMFHMVNQTWLSSGKTHIKPRMLSLLRDRQKKAWDRTARSIDAFSKSVQSQYPDAMYIFTSDHGDNFGDEGWRYHFSNVTEAGNRVPLFVSGRGIETAQSIDHPTSIRFLYHLITTASQSNESLETLLPEQYSSVPVIESFWYNKDGKTLPKYQSDQFAFIHAGRRYTKNGNGWNAYKLGSQDSALIDAVPYDADPVYDLNLSQDIRNTLIDQYESFQQFSESIA